MPDYNEDAMSSVRLILLAAFCWSAHAQPLLKEGDSAFQAGDYPAARRSFEKALKIAPANSPARYDVLKRLTSASAAAGQFADAQNFLDQAIQWRESTLGPQDPKIADDLVLSINLEMRTKDFDRALSTAQRVQTMHTQAYTADSIPVADDLLRIGQIYMLQKQPNKAVRPFIAAHQVRTKLLGSLDAGLLPVLDRINDAFEAMGGGNASIYRQALAIRETLYGVDSPELISTIDGLANTYSKEQQFAAAEPLYLRLVALWESVGGKDHPMVAVVLDKLVVFYAKKGEVEKAREALARSVAIRSGFLAVGLSHQAADEISQEHQEQAKALYHRALVALGPSTPANEDLIEQIKKALADLHAPTTK
jgi:tetratricopeptide (TPR) repeat protein